MVAITERQELRRKLVEQGFTWEFIDEPNPKTVMYRHAPGMNVEGEVVFPVGSIWPGKTTTDARYILSKAKIGVFPFPPSEGHDCKWCAANKVEVGDSVQIEEQESVPEESIQCQNCDKTLSALTKAGALSQLRVHMKEHEKVAQL